MALLPPNLFTKLAWSLPWLLNYPLWRGRELVRRLAEASGPTHLICIVANHFEPAWNEDQSSVSQSVQLRRVDRWCEQARAIGAAVKDSDGTPFRHTYFYPAEQYHVQLLNRLAALQREGLGEVEIHLHHGVDAPDTAENLVRVLTEFRDVLAHEHECLAQLHGSGPTRYAFVHGNSALANSAGGKNCGVDNEMQILADTGCYLDLTLPSAPDRSQVKRLNAIYQCGHDFNQPRPHRSGPDVCVGDAENLRLPLILTGPLVFNWQRRLMKLPVPRLDDGVLAANQPMDLARFERWRNSRISVNGRPDWIFVKLYCHGFFEYDNESVVGERARRFFNEIVDQGERDGNMRVHFASAREAFNMMLAAVDGLDGNPHAHRNYRLTQIMDRTVKTLVVAVTFILCAT